MEKLADDWQRWIDSIGLKSLADALEDDGYNIALEIPEQDYEQYSKIAAVRAEVPLTMPGRVAPYDTLAGMYETFLAKIANGDESVSVDDDDRVWVEGGISVASPKTSRKSPRICFAMRSGSSRFCPRRESLRRGWIRWPRVFGRWRKRPSSTPGVSNSRA